MVLEAPASRVAEMDRLAAIAERLLPELEEDLGVQPLAPYFIVLLPPVPEQDEELRALDRTAPRWASGFLHPEARVGAIRLDRVPSYPYDDLPMVLLHEAAHMLLHDAVADVGHGERLPRWFEEGTATWVARRWGLNDFVVQTSSALAGNFPTLDELDRAFQTDSGTAARSAYAASFDFVRWSVRRYGDDFVPRLLDVAAERPFEEAWNEVAGRSLESSVASWRRTTLFIHRWIPLLTGSGMLWIAITGMVLLVGMARRQRTRRLYEKWDEEERRRAEALLRSLEDEPPDRGAVN
jgi:hypothetical protein